MERHIFLYDEIGMFGKNADEIAKEVNAFKPKDEIIIHISSPGGEVFEGWAIGNIIAQHPGKVTAKIQGICASIATYIALQANEVQMAENSRFMIHNPATMAMGEEKDLEAAKEQLASIKDSLINTYEKKTGIGIDEISQMMDDETWMNASEAKEKGFVDVIIESEKAVAKVGHQIIDKMSEAKKETKLDGIVSRMENWFNEVMENLEPKKITNVNVELEDGTMIFVESEDGELEGKPAFTVDEEGNPTDSPAPDGTHMLNDGRSITIADGIVESVQETSEEDSAEIENLKAKLEEAKSENDTLKAENKKLGEDQKALEKSTTENIAKVKQELENKFQAFKNETLGEEPEVPVAEVDMNKKAQVDAMDSYAAYLRNKRK